MNKNLYSKYRIKRSDFYKIWIATLGMLSWSLVFYDFEMKGITFIYYIIKPKFLFIFGNMSINVLLMMIYYSALIFAFNCVIKLFYKINKKHSIKENLKSEQIIEI